MENSCVCIIGLSDHGICFPSLLSRVLIGYADGTSCLATAGQGDQTGSGAVALRIVA